MEVQPDDNSSCCEDITLGVESYRQNKVVNQPCVGVHVSFCSLKKVKIR